VAESSDFLQQELEEIDPFAAPISPTVKADAFIEVEKITNANMSAIPFTAAKIRFYNE